MSHLSVIDTTTIAREEYTAHGLHLDLRDKKKLMHLIADKLDGCQVSGVSSIPVIMRARAAPFIRINTKSQRHLRVIDTNYRQFINHGKNLD